MSKHEATGAEHVRRRLVVAADWAITAASRQRRADHGGGLVAEVVVADDGLLVMPPGLVLRKRFDLRAGAFGLTTGAPEVVR